MTAPALSVVVPTLNEEGCIEAFLHEVSQYLARHTASWEIVVVDDGSQDRTPELVEAFARRQPAVRLMRLAHRGKGAAIRQGMLEARGAWRFMADADLSVTPDDWTVFLDAAYGPAAPDVIIGSREAPGSRRIGEPVSRHLIGRVFNFIVQLLAVQGINDTQCGFKLLSAPAATAILPHLTLDGFAFDVELLFLARRAGFTIREVGVVWTCRPDSRVRLSRGAAAFLDVVRIRVRQMTGRYAGVSRHAAAASTGMTRAS